jgi:YebC/PmpR family DNA-binding regulatory protein
MSGHSKWHQIKRKKEVTDAKRGQAFTRLAAQIKQATRAGKDPTTNAALAEAITRAKRANMPQANIDRLLCADDTSSQEVVYEAFGPGGIALLIIARTDNGRRTIAELRTLLKEHDGSLGQPGSVRWKFEQAGDRYVAKYPQPLTGEADKKLAALLAKLTAHPDVEGVVADAVE